MVAKQPFSFALTDPYVRTSRIWLYPMVTSKQASRRTEMRAPSSRKGKARKQQHQAVQVMHR